MATIIFYQKPGCATNARQINALTAAGHHVIAKDILKEPWRTEELRSFFGLTPIVSWFNPSAPRVKSGEVNPGAIDAAGALALMLGDPLLIRRPLIDADGARCAGFDREPVPSLLGRIAQDDLIGCSREGRLMDCPSE
ncbi:ArsC/Spx/MgsR family protein [Bradyrhizobium sp. NAS96.2]|uniref:ArsC/Spx/MgsR family protein n=1 Tax=Bradyrhizobium sp. NAS96.2 TaxID=1680160 RepID=UPI00093A862C|nr:ArsC/Spx/MgsR family protein [Bradyrhizobium sp. NAS96.2]OKO84285.1 arsenate reductase [Bradyrhizobium sp. NAS96.2]